MATLCVGSARMGMLGSDSIVGNASTSVPGAAGETTSELLESRGIPNMILADGPAGLRLVPHFLADENDNPIYEATQLNTEDDVDGIYDMIRNFFKEYNDLIKEIDTLYGAESAKDYEPLTSEEKDAMTDDEIEKWEKKIKDSLLRRDSNLGDIRSTLKTAMQASFTIGGKNYSLASFGISTQGYFDAADGEKSLLHIDGDSADTVSSGNTDKLKQMIATNPDTVSSFFTKLATNLYDSMQKMSRSSGNRTFGNFYDDKVLNSQYDDYKSKISKQEEKLNNLEDKYYKMFSSMETQLSKINSTSNYISSMLGS